MALRILMLVTVLLLAACAETETPTAGACETRAALAQQPQWTGACVQAELDWADATCRDATYAVGLCTGATVIDGGEFGAAHIGLSQAITYTDDPPMSGPHRGEWGFWGEYGFLPSQRWLHNLEHGGLTILYNPCVPESLIDTLRTWAQNTPPDDGGPFRWVLTPYPNLDSAFSLVTWQHRLKANCFDAATANKFMADHYRKAPEDEPYDGSYACTWLGRSCGMAGGGSTSADATTMSGIQRDAD